MRISEFKIRNFKGINNASLKLGDIPGAIHTLVGLNESGKTTILEALNSFRPDIEGVHAIAQKTSLDEPKEDLIPKSRKDDFTDKIEIEAIVEFGDTDLHKIKKFCESELDLVLNINELVKKFSIIRTLEYKNSKFIKLTNYWKISFPVKTKRQKEIPENFL